MRGSATGEGGAPPSLARKERHRRRRGRSVAVAGRDERRRPSGGGSAVGRQVTRETRGIFLFLLAAVSQGSGGQTDERKQISQGSMHDYCFLPCMWSQVIDLFPSKKAGIAEMTFSFSIA